MVKAVHKRGRVLHCDADQTAAGRDAILLCINTLLRWEQAWESCCRGEWGAKPAGWQAAGVPCDRPHISRAKQLVKLRIRMQSLGGGIFYTP